MYPPEDQFLFPLVASNSCRDQGVSIVKLGKCERDKSIDSFLVRVMISGSVHT